VPSTSVSSELFRKEIFATTKSLGWFTGLPIWEDLHLSTKAGPNGQAMMGAMSDLSYLTDQNIQDLGILTGNKINHLIDNLKTFSLDSFNKHFGITPKGILSKLSVIKDKEAKSRIIAILDYWSQSSLRPLHLGLFSLLKRVRGDCTFDQASFVTHLPKKGPYFSYDLTAATDRFPLEFQKIVVSAVVGSENYAQAWARVIADREFSVPWTGESIKYRSGQPMGAYSSWAVFALSHHLVVRIAAVRAGLKPSFSNYALLGDDIVLTNSAVAEQYRTILSQLGVSISEQKSHVSIDTYEFAKRWIHRGQEMTGAPLSILCDSKVLKWYTAVSFIRDVEARWCPNSYLATRRLFAELITISGQSVGYAYRLGTKAMGFYNLPLKGESYRAHFLKALYFDKMYMDNVIGCSPNKYALNLFWAWLAEAKTNVLEEAIKKQTKLLNQFLSELNSLAGLLPEGLDSQSALRFIVPVRVVLNNLQDLQATFDCLRKDFENARDRKIVLDSPYQRAVDPTQVWTKRQSQLVLYNQAALLNKVSRMTKEFIEGRNKLLSSETYDYPDPY